MVRNDLAKHGFEDSPRCGVVLTGGGAQLEGLLEMAEQIFDCGVRYGLPRGLGGLVDVIGSPSWCTASGLLLYALSAEESQQRGRRRTLSVRAMINSLRGMFTELL